MSGRNGLAMFSTAALLAACALAAPARSEQPSASMRVEGPEASAPTLAEELAGRRPVRNPLQALASSYVAIPASANVQGSFGAFFKTRVSVLNITQSSIFVTATLLTQSGVGGTKGFSVGAGQTATFGNALQDLFGYSGGGAVVLESSSTSQEFIVTSEVYVDGGSGRFSTAVETQNSLDFVGSYPDLTVGVLVDGSNRSNVGCMNDSNQSATARGRVYDASGAQVGTLNFTLPSGTWVQGGINFNVNRGAILWDASVSYIYCYAVNVNNASNDGTFLGRTTYVP